MIKKTDIQIDKNIICSYQIFYDKNTNQNLAVMLKLIKYTLKSLYSKVNYDKNVVIRLCGIKSRRTAAQHFSRSNLIEIDVKKRKKPQDFISLLCHELVHSEQHNEGRLIQDYSGIKWHGVLYSRIKFDTTSPWEIEAYSRQNELAKIVIKELIGN